MANTYEAIAQFTLTGTANPVTFTSIPQTYTDLVIVQTARDDYADISDGTVIRFNGDSGSNYSMTQLRGNGSSATSTRYSSETYLRFPNDVVAGATSASGTVGVAIYQIMNYSNTTTYKTTLARANVAGSGTNAVVGLWRSTAAITQVSFIGYSGSYVTGSTFTLFGIKAA